MKKSLYLTIALVFISSFTIAQDEMKADKEKDEKEDKSLPIKPERFFELKTNEGSMVIIVF